MKILVPIKRVVDANIKVRIRSDRTDVETNNLKMAVNPFCEIAIEEALRIREAKQADEVIAVSVGPQACQEQLRTALALGADRAIHVVTESMPQPLQIAKVLKALVDREQSQLVILGKQSIDGDNGQTGQMLAALAGMPQGTFASKLEFADNEVLVTREVDGGLQQVALKLPAVITTDLRLNEPRYASLPNIMKAKRKPIENLTAEELSVDIASNLQQTEVNQPPERPAGLKVASVEELIDKLKNEAGVLA